MAEITESEKNSLKRTLKSRNIQINDELPWNALWVLDQYAPHLLTADNVKKISVDNGTKALLESFFDNIRIIAERIDSHNNSDSFSSTDHQFASAARDLKKLLETDFTLDLKKAFRHKKPYNSLKNSDAILNISAMSEAMDSLNKSNYTDLNNENIQCNIKNKFETLENNIKSQNPSRALHKAMITFLATGIGVMLGATAGCVAGIAAGGGITALTGPGAIVGALVGGIMGTKAGVAIGFAAGAAVGGIIAGSSAGSACIFFKDKENKAEKRKAVEAFSKAQPSP
ncbi:hypothetical protein [Piscirickettsia litoralis]|uniref:Glycine zipper family protein n=1 Tax=Piscirickettsia litoralis TaxID=1891921 RepID=A0ABX3A0F6_9GAMM|nr:hypothetical protein [Piscirickettsia litoralis]ODN41108.1 hypothetical protein BGC07_18355 [Piscirickettsia litoralis]